jgi:hypothetical protein
VSGSHSSSLTGNSSPHAPTAGLWGPDDRRLSRPVLREPGGEIPPGHSPEGTSSRPVQLPDQGCLHDDASMTHKGRRGDRGIPVSSGVMSPSDDLSDGPVPSQPAVAVLAITESRVSAITGSRARRSSNLAFCDQRWPRRPATGAAGAPQRGKVAPPSCPRAAMRHSMWNHRPVSGSSDCSSSSPGRTCGLGPSRRR